MKKHGVSRRDFLRLGASAVALGALAPRSLLAADEESSTIEKRVLGRTRLEVTTVSLGCMVAPQPVIAKAFDMGINWFDTAHAYKRGRNEVEVADALGDKRDKAYICTKLPKGSTKSMLDRLDTSLQRLRTDHVELLLTHGAASRGDVFNDDYIAALEKAKKDGKTRFIGVSTHARMAEVVNAAVEAKIYDALLVKYSYNASGDELKKAIADAKKAGVGIIAMKTQLGNFPNPDGGMTPHQAALKWVLDDENVACAVPGMRNFQQLEQNFAVMAKRLALFDRRRLERYVAATAHLQCASCGECDGQCPYGVDVPEVRRCAMYLDGYRDEELARENYEALTANAAPCLDCETCTVQCARNRGVALQPMLREAHRRLA